MVSFNKTIFSALLLGILSIPAISDAQIALESDDYSDRAVGLAMSVSPLDLQSIDFSRASVSFIPSYYESIVGETIRFGVVAPQVWLSSNLAMVGGIGMGTGGGNLSRVVRIAVRYLPETLSIKGFAPEVVLAQSRITGLPSISTLKWNEAQLMYKSEIVGWQFSAGMRLLYQRIFTTADWNDEGIPLRIVRTRRQLTASFGRTMGGWLAITAQGGLATTQPTGVMTLSIAL